MVLRTITAAITEPSTKSLKPKLKAKAAKSTRVRALAVGQLGMHNRDFLKDVHTKLLDEDAKSRDAIVTLQHILTATLQSSRSFIL